MYTLYHMTHGIFYLILASLCYAVMSIFIRIVNTEIPPFSQMFLRYFVTVTLAFIFVKLQKQTIKSKTSNGLILMILVAFFGYTLSTVFFTFSILATTIATTLFLFSTNVIIAPILAFIILKERMPRNLLIAIGLSLIGALLLFQPDFQSKSVIGPLFALLASFATAVYYVGRRALKNHSAATMMFYATTTGFISMAAAAFIFERSFYSLQTLSNISPFVWFILFIFALDNFAAWYLVNKGFETIKAGTGSIVLLLEPVLGVLIGLSIYNEIPTIVSTVGIIAIISGIFIATQ